MVINLRRPVLCTELPNAARQVALVALRAALNNGKAAKLFNNDIDQDALAKIRRHILMDASKLADSAQAEEDIEQWCELWSLSLAVCQCLGSDAVGTAEQAMRVQQGSLFKDAQPVVVPLLSMERPTNETATVDAIQAPGDSLSEDSRQTKTPKVQAAASASPEQGQALLESGETGKLQSEINNIFPFMPSSAREEVVKMDVACGKKLHLLSAGIMDLNRQLVSQKEELIVATQELAQSQRSCSELTEALQHRNRERDLAIAEWRQQAEDRDATLLRLEQEIEFLAKEEEFPSDAEPYLSRKILQAGYRKYAPTPVERKPAMLHGEGKLFPAQSPPQTSGISRTELVAASPKGYTTVPLESGSQQGSPEAALRSRIDGVCATLHCLGGKLRTMAEVEEQRKTRS